MSLPSATPPSCNNARKKTKNSPAAHGLQIYPSDCLWLAQVDEHIHDIITDLIS
ncbi:MAG: hypothetical protein IGS48_09125 [Oscillatoriales cyanobacterium C42_A2020_001]|nr:hypothetical protein [Leptolyngbyaceae cyanobacterium C42_A2020_001]